MISGLVPCALNWSKDERGGRSHPAQGRGMPDVAYNLRRRLQWFLLLRVGLTTCLLAATVFLYYRHGGDNTPAGERLRASRRVVPPVPVIQKDGGGQQARREPHPQQQEPLQAPTQVIRDVRHTPSLSRVRSPPAFILRPVQGERDKP